MSLTGLWYAGAIRPYTTEKEEEKNNKQSKRLEVIKKTTLPF